MGASGLIPLKSSGRHLQQTVKDQVLGQLKRHRHAGRHFPTRTTGHEALGLSTAVDAQVLDHALHCPGNGKGAAAGQGVAGVGGEFAHRAGGHMQTGGACFERAQHDAVTGQDNALKSKWKSGTSPLSGWS